VARNVVAYSRLLKALRIRLSRSEQRALARVVRRLRVDALPALDDYETLHPYAGTAWARRVPGLALWLIYRFDAKRLDRSRHAWVRSPA
jgi:hypothetical protein